MGTNLEFPPRTSSSSSDTNEIHLETKHKSLRALSNTERDILTTLNNAFKNWFQPWKDTYLNDGEEFCAIYDAMEALIHYEQQITLSESVLSKERLNAIAQAVARLVDYGNAILNIDMIIRHPLDESSHELDPSQVTTIELYEAHIRAQKLRDKLRLNYFKKDTSKRFSADNDTVPVITTLSPTSSLQVPSLQSHSNLSSPTLERSHKLSTGSNVSINTLIPLALNTSHDSAYSSGRKTPSQLPIGFTTTQSYIELRQADTNNSGNTSNCNALPDNDLINSELELIHMTATIRSSAFSSPDNTNTRMVLLHGVLAKIDSLMISSPTNQHEKIKHCFKFLSTLLDVIEKLPIESRKDEVQAIADSLLKPLVRKVYVDDRDNFVEFQHSHWTTYLLSLIRLMTASDFNLYLRRNFPNLADLSAFLKDFLFIVKRFIATKSDTSLEVNEPIYPSCWIEMSLLVCSTLLKSMTYLYQILRQCFASNLQIWNSYLDCLLHFILHDSLRPSRLMFRNRQAMLAYDLRKTAAEYVWITWDSLEYDQLHQILEDILEPLLRGCMILGSNQRAILLPIFYDMMRCDYTSQYITPRGGSTSGTLTNSIEQQIFEDDFIDAKFIYEDDLDDAGARQNSGESLPCLSFKGQTNSSSDDGTVLTKFTHLMIGKLNYLMMDLDLGDEEFKIELCAAISGDSNTKYNPKHHANQCSTSTFNSINDDAQFKHMARQTSNLIAEFMQICLDSRQANRLSYNHLFLLCLFKLILFFRDKVDIIELYLANLLKLWNLHHRTGRYVEAGFTLLEHAKSIPWSNDPLESHYRIITSNMQTPEPLTDLTSLKIFLYTTIIKYFDEGQLWEAAVPLCRELIDIYQFQTYQFDKLADILMRLSQFFNNIITNGSALGLCRAHPAYFRVTFYGQGFPGCIRDSTMVYRGRPFEKLGDFQATLLNKYSDATLLKTLTRPENDLLCDQDAKYLMINACNPIVNLKSKLKVENVNRIPDPILEYYKRNECDKFEFDRKINRNDDASGPNSNEFANIWRERTRLVTNSLPGMLPFFPVFLTETSIISPIECAIEDLISTNDRLSCMVNRFRADKRHEEDVRPLGQLLLGIVDAAVNGGITKYEEAFFGHEQHQQHVTALPPPTTTTTATCFSVPQQQQQQQQQQTQVLLPLSSQSPSSTLNLESNFASQLTVSTNSSGARQQLSNGSMFAHQRGRPQQPLRQRPNAEQVKKLKTLIAHQVPLLDEAIRLHRERVADIMRPQHEHLELSYKTLRNRIMSKYASYLPSEYNRSSSMRSYRSLARTPNRSSRSESRLSPSGMMIASTMTRSPTNGRLATKRLSDTGRATGQVDDDADNRLAGSNIPYRQLQNERRSLPFLSGVSASNVSLVDNGATKMKDKQGIGDRHSACQSKQILVDSDASSDQEVATAAIESRGNYSTRSANNQMPLEGQQSFLATRLAPPHLPAPRSRASASLSISMAPDSPVPRQPPVVTAATASDSPYVCVTDLLKKATFGKNSGELPYARLGSRQPSLSSPSPNRLAGGAEDSESDSSSRAESDQEQRHQAEAQGDQTKLVSI